MKVVENNIIPFPGFLAINLFGVLFVRKDSWGKKSEERRQIVYNHESIHTAQMKELWYIFFYIMYFLEWLFRLVTKPKTAYESISFEREAYGNEENPDYLSTRKHFAQWKKK